MSLGSARQLRSDRVHADNLARIEFQRSQMAERLGLKPDGTTEISSKVGDAKLGTILAHLGRDYGGPIEAGALSRRRSGP